MKKNIKDYLHLYLGCEVIGENGFYQPTKGYLTGVTNGGTECEIQFFLEDGFNVSEEPDFNEVEKVKPILRPLSDISDEEDKECSNIMFGEFADKVVRKNIIHYEGEKVKYLLSKHFDLFGLIEARLAIDKTTLK